MTDRPGTPRQTLSYLRALLDAHDAAAQAQQEKTLKEVKRLRQSVQELRNVGINSGSDAAQLGSGTVDCDVKVVAMASAAT